jgi:hypothetical protein
MKYIVITTLCSPLFTSIVSAAMTSPPEPNLRKTPAAWMGFMLMFLFFGIMVTISLMTSKRGHQD